MRLLHSKHLTFESFTEDESIPEYAILSHTWQDDEITYKELRKWPEQARLRTSYRKIAACARRALADGLEYFWIDTCCIDKTSSAELSEAINSMFMWYRNATMCYAYLFDTPSPRDVRGTGTGTGTGTSTASTITSTITAGTGTNISSRGADDGRRWTEAFQRSRWFTRGWTLQELIAPTSLEFYARDWSFIGTKEDLTSIITNRTGIPAEVIVSGDFSKASIAQRMSWAAGRSTSRKEDAAYCLIGLFDVSMTMLYGEGDKAFLRLQEEIIKRSDDLSIFSWVSSRASSFSAYRGLLAWSIADFAQCNDIRWARGTKNDPYQATNKGIHISLPLASRSGRPDEYIALLCGVCKKPNMKIGVFLQKIGEEQYARVEPDQLAMPQSRAVTAVGTSKGSKASDAGDAGSLVSLYVRQNVIMESASHSRAAGISVRGGLSSTSSSSGLRLIGVKPSTRWDAAKRFFSFSTPVALRRPPAAVFALRLAEGGEGDGNEDKDENEDNGTDIVITIDAAKPWREVLEVGGGWDSSPAPGRFTNKVHCHRPRHPVIEVVAERGLFDGEAKILLSVVVRSSDADEPAGSPPTNSSRST